MSEALGVAAIDTKSTRNQQAGAGRLLDLTFVGRVGPIRFCIDLYRVLRSGPQACRRSTMSTARMLKLRVHPHGTLLRSANRQGHASKKLSR